MTEEEIKSGETAEERLAAARRLIEGDGEKTASGQIAEGARVVRELAEKNDCLDAWKYMLECHERGVGPFKTNKFRRAAKAAIARLEAVQVRVARTGSSLLTDLSWCKDAATRDLMMREYADARRLFDRIVTKYVKPTLTRKFFDPAARRLGLEWGQRSLFSQTEAFAVIDFTTMHDDSCGFVPVHRALSEIRVCDDPDLGSARAMVRQMRYTWGKILEMEPGCGLKCRDMLTGEDFVLFERNMSTTPELLGGAIATGIMPVPAAGCFMHTGFSVPFPNADVEGGVDEAFDELLEALEFKRTRPIVLSRAESARLAAVTIRSFLSSDMADNLRLSFNT